MVQPGVSHEKTLVVTEGDAIHFMGEGVTPALATPTMIMWMEITSRDAVLPHLDPGQDTVGTHVNVAHLAATPVGMKVTLRATVTAVEKRRVTLFVEAHDEKEKIGEGTHERFIVDVNRFAERLAAKAAGE